MLGMLLEDAFEPQDHSGAPSGWLGGRRCPSAEAGRAKGMPPLRLPAPVPPCGAGFCAAWRACPASTALKHLDVDAPRLMRGLYEQDVSGGCSLPRASCRLPSACSSGHLGCSCLPASPVHPPPPSRPAAGLWAQKPVQCASGDYLPGDYSGWKRWRDALPEVQHI